MSAKKIKVAIVGAGLIGRKRALAINHLANFELSGVYDTNTKAAKSFASEYSGKVYDSLKEVLEDRDVDLVILAIIHKFAASLAPKIVSKKHLLIEKPAGRNYAETKKIVEEAKKSGKKLFVGFNYRFYPHVAFLKEMLIKKKLGKIVSSTFRIGHAANPGYEKTWKMSKDLCGGGVILDPGVHLLDLANILLGEAQDFSVQKNNLGWNSEVEDEAFIHFKYSNGSYSQHHYSLNLSQNTFFIEIVGNKGVARLVGRGGNYGPMKFEFVPRWFWQGKEIVSKNFGSDDNSFEDEVKEIGKQLKKDQSLNYEVFLNEMKLIDKIYS